MIQAYLFWKNPEYVTSCQPATDEFYFPEKPNRTQKIPKDAHCERRKVHVDPLVKVSPVCMNNRRMIIKLAEVSWHIIHMFTSLPPTPIVP